MFRASCSILIMLLVSAVAAAGEPLNNRQFCDKAMSLLADSLLDQLQLEQKDTAWALLDDSRILLGQSLIERMHERGVALYLGDESSVDQHRMQIHVAGELVPPQLSYELFDQGLFRQGKIRRVCEVQGEVALLGIASQLKRTAQVGGLKLIDSLTYDQARAAREGDGLYAPELPASLFQRVVEPTLVVGITGTLVYLFFASR